VAQEAWQQVEPRRINGDRQERHVVRVDPLHVEQDDSQVLQAPPLVRYFPAIQESQFEEVVPEQVAQEGSQQVPPTRTNGGLQERHIVLADPLQVLQEAWHGLQALLLVKNFPSTQERQVVSVIPLQVTQEAWQQVPLPLTKTNGDVQEVHCVRDDPAVHVLHDV